MLDAGYQWVKDVVDSGKLTFSTLIGDNGNHYMYRVKFSYGHMVEIRDSLKTIPLRVEQIPPAFGLEDAKLKLDYKAKRERGHVLTEHEKAYVREDVVIVAKAMHIMLDEGMSKLTAGSNALKAYKDSIGGEKAFRKRFPVPDYDAEVRLAYKGGWTYANPRFQGKVLGPGWSFDVNSLYPYVMRTKLLPYGDPVPFYGEPEPDELRPLWVCAVEIDCKLKPNHVPCIQVKEGAYADRFKPTEYVEDTKGPIIRYITNVDYELIRSQYDVISITFMEGWRWKGSTELFADFIDHWTDVKIKASREGNAGMRFIAKRIMNSSYGKLGTNPVCAQMRPVKRGGRVYYERLEKESREPVYIPAAVFITAYARYHTITAAQANFDRFVYSDTDSVYLVGQYPPVGMKVDDYELGAWKNEHRFDRIKVLRAKTYVFEEGGKLYIHCAGLPERAYDLNAATEGREKPPEGYPERVTFDNFNIGASYWGKLYQHHVDGGIVLADGDFTIR